MRQRRSGANEELEQVVDAAQRKAANEVSVSLSGGEVCLLATLTVLTLLVLVVAALSYHETSTLNARLNAILPNATEVLAERQTLEMRAVGEAAQAFRKRHWQAPPP